MKTWDLQQIQAREFDILCEFDRVCRENGLRYGLCGGTLLGAVRHGGFIPWDDDIDVVMPRPDYERLKQLADKALLPAYRLETPYNNRDTIHAYGKICDFRTVLIEFPEGKRIRTHLYIDVFPIDGMPDGAAAQEKHRKKTRKRMLTLYGFRVAKYKRNERLGFGKRCFWRIVSVVNKLLPATYLAKRVDKLAKKYEYDSASDCGVIVAGYGAVEIMPRAVFGFGNEVEFCGRKFFAPDDPNHYLTALYGDYMQLPPVEKRVHHEMTVYEADEEVTR